MTLFFRRRGDAAMVCIEEVRSCLTCINFPSVEGRLFKLIYVDVMDIGTVMNMRACLWQIVFLPNGNVIFRSLPDILSSCV